MRLLTLIGAAVLGGAVAWAADAPAPVPPPVPSTNVSLNLGELQILMVALANSGAACDQKVQIYCQITQMRDGIMGKLQIGMNAVQQPAPAKK